MYGKNFYLWSRKYQLFWKADRGGYTKNINEAGLYTKQETDEILAEEIGDEFAIHTGCIYLKIKKMFE